MEFPSMSGGMGLTGWTGGFGGSQSGGTDWGAVIGGALSGLGNVLAARTIAKNQPAPYQAMGFAGALPAAIGRAAPYILGAGGAMLPDLLGGLAPSGVEVSATPGVFAGGPLDAFRTSFYTAGQTRYNARRLIPVQAPNGTLHFWRHVGTPVVFSGDLALRKRLTKVGRRLGAGACARKSVRRRR
jgi:hypothetical protein